MPQSFPNLSYMKGGEKMRKKIAILLSIALVLPMVLIAMPASADYGTYTDRLSGATRVETAVEISKIIVPTTNSKTSVVVARKDLYPDALAGAVLARQLGTSVVLTDSASLDTATANEIKRVLADSGACTVYVLGGTGAISASVATAIAALQTNITVTRVSGADRYATAVEIAKLATTTATCNRYLVVTGENFPDALAAAAAGGRLGANNCIPVLLVKGDSVPDSVKSLILGGTRTCTITIIGGTGAVSQAVVNELAGLTSGSISRVSGADRYATAVEVAKAASLWNKAATSTSAAQTWTIARGDDFADAVCGAALGRPLLLTLSTALSTATSDYLGAIYPTGGTKSSAYVLGGTGAISDSVEQSVATKVSCGTWGLVATPLITSVAGDTTSPAGPSSVSSPAVVVSHRAGVAGDVLYLYDATTAPSTTLATASVATVGATTTTISAYNVASISLQGSRTLKVKLVDANGNASDLSAGFTYIYDVTAPQISTVAYANTGTAAGVIDNGDTITITFNEAIATASIGTTNTFTNSFAGGSIFTGVGGFATPGTSSGTYAAVWSADGKTLTLTLTVTAWTSNPSGNFAGVATIKDLAGNSLSTAYVIPTTGSSW